MANRLQSKKITELDKKLLFEQYKLMVSSAESITERRQHINRFYLGINSFVLAVASYTATTLSLPTIPYFISGIGVSICLVWLLNIKSYKSLNRAKFKIIHKLEESLPAKIYTEENIHLEKKYYGLTSVEKWVPIVFGAAYLFLILLTIF